MRRHLGCPYANKNVLSNRLQNSPSSVSAWAVAVPAASVPDLGSGSGETPVAKTGTGPRDDPCVDVG